MTGRRLDLDDIADARAYEREREWFRDRVIEMKKKRRIPIGPVVSLVFENRETVRFQVQEMARAERLLSDAAIQAELDTYNPLIPGPGQLSATLYIELTNRAELEHWLPRLVGIERAVHVELLGGVSSRSGPESVVCDVDPAHAANLVRQEMTATVHFVRFTLTPAQIERFRTGAVNVAVHHRQYEETTPLSETSKEALLGDLLG